MESVFLKVLNMSVTAGYVILAVLAVRLLLFRAPKKYAYLLWSVVLFRLVCPVSLPSQLSVFGLKPFDMSAAQSLGAEP
jgi:beta-lactamase regulating signal transducer with metallopeptidase domain